MRDEYLIMFPLRHEEYSISDRQPDVIYIHNPYDNKQQSNKYSS